MLTPMEKVVLSAHKQLDLVLLVTNEQLNWQYMNIMYRRWERNMGLNPITAD